LLLQQEGVWQVFDRWLAELSPETFIEILPLIRRAFADFTGPERRQMGEKVRHLNTTADGAGRRTSPVPDIDTVDLARARQVLPILAHVLGVSLTPDS
jgi:hypothetical protein